MWRPNRTGVPRMSPPPGGNVLMSITTAMTSVPKPAPELIEAFRGAPTSVISDNLARLPGAVGLRPFHRGSQLVGIAFTVRTRPGDNLAIHQALELVGPGDVIVVDGGGDETRALVGEIMKNIAEYRGAAGYVIDGAIRDVAAFAGIGISLLCPRGHPPRALQERAGRNQRAGFDRRLGDLAGRHRGRRRGRRGVVSRLGRNHGAGGGPRPDRTRGADDRRRSARAATRAATASPESTS